MKKTFLLTLLTAFTFLQSVSAQNTTATKIPMSDSELATRWHDIILMMIEQSANTGMSGFQPTVSARALAYINFAFYEATVAKSNKYQSLSGQVNTYKLPQLLAFEGDSSQYFAPAAANESIGFMVENLIEPTTYLYMKRAYKLRDSTNAIYAKYVPKTVLENSRNHGIQIAKHIFEWSKKDGGHQAFIKSYDMAYDLKMCDSCYVINVSQDLENTGPIHPNWGRNRTFAVENSLDSVTNLIRPCIPFSAKKDSEFYKQAYEVYLTKDIKPDSDPYQIAYFWDDPAAASFTPAGHSVSILSQVLRKKTVSLEAAAEAYCKLGMALSDAFVSCWRVKYRENLIRPWTYIKRYIDRSFEPRLLTPPFPEFPSGHTVQAFAMATVLSSLFGQEYEFTDWSRYYAGKPRSFPSFWAAAEEASISRFYGGIHFRDALEQGKFLGQIVGVNVMKMRFKR